MNGFGTGPVGVPESQHSIFIRGFPGDMDMNRIKDFFEKEAGHCTFDFFKQSADTTRLFVAVRFDTRDIARDTMARFNNKEIFGHRVYMTWFKDIRRYVAYTGQMLSTPFPTPPTRGTRGRILTRGGTGRGFVHSTESTRGMFAPRGRGVYRGGGGALTTSTYQSFYNPTVQKLRARARAPSVVPTRTVYRDKSKSRSSSRSSRNFSEEKEAEKRSESSSRSRSPTPGSKASRSKSPKRSRSRNSRERRSSPPSSYKVVGKTPTKERIKRKRQSSNSSRSSGEASPSPVRNKKTKKRRQRSKSPPESDAGKKEEKTGGDGAKNTSLNSSRASRKQKKKQVEESSSSSSESESEEADRSDTGTPCADEREPLFGAKGSMAAGALTGTSTPKNPDQKLKESTTSHSTAKSSKNRSSPDRKSRSRSSGKESPERSKPPEKTKPEKKLPSAVQAIHPLVPVSKQTEEKTERGSLEKATSSSLVDDIFAIQKSTLESVQSDKTDKKKLRQRKGKKEKEREFKLSSFTKEVSSENDRQKKISTLPPEKLHELHIKRKELEQSYKQDCDTFATVVKMLISKDPSMEEKLLSSLRDALKDIGQKFITELNEFVDALLLTE